MKIAFHLVAEEERQWVISEILKDSKDPLQCCCDGIIHFSEGYIQGEENRRKCVCVCASRVGGCKAAYHYVCFERVRLCWLMSICSVCVSVECPVHAILFLIQNKITQSSPHQSFTVRHVHYFSVCRPFPQACPVQTTGKNFISVSQ